MAIFYQFKCLGDHIKLREDFFENGVFVQGEVLFVSFQQCFKFNLHTLTILVNDIILYINLIPSAVIHFTTFSDKAQWFSPIELYELHVNESLEHLPCLTDLV